MKSMLAHESGAILFVTLLFLGVLSILGSAATTTSSLELQIASNDRIYKDNLYRAEAAAMEAAQQIKNAAAQTLRKRTPPWLNADAPDLKKPDNWNSSNSAESAGGAERRYAVVDEGIQPGASLNLGGSTVHRFAIFGRCDRSGGAAMVKVGLKRRF